MLGLLVLYFIGKAYYNLAQIHGKSKWGFAILGCAIYYGVMILAGVIMGILAVIFNWEGLFELPEIVLGLITIPFGLLAQWGIRILIKNNWEGKAKHYTKDTLLDDLD